MSQIRYFIAVSETLNFTRAAERCCISQPALTKGVQRLECDIGGSLLNRSRSSVELTDLGRMLLPDFKGIYNSAIETKKRAKRIVCQDQAVIRLGFQSNISVETILSKLAQFQQEYGAEEIKLFEHSHAVLKSELEAKNLDLAFFSEVDCNESGEGEKSVCKEELVIVFSPQHRFSSMPTVTMANLHQERFCFREHCESSEYIVNMLLCHDIDLNVVYTSSRDDNLRPFILNDFCIALLPKRKAMGVNLPFKSISDCKLTRNIYAQSSKRSDSGKRIGELMQSLSESLYGDSVVC